VRCATVVLSGGCIVVREALRAGGMVSVVGFCPQLIFLHLGVIGAVRLIANTKQLYCS
jgi:hypothetical protein